MLQDKLEVAFHHFFMNSIRCDKPRGILMRADTWWELLSQAGVTGGKRSLFEEGKFLYRGIQVYRSNDIPKDEFIIF